MSFWDGISPCMDLGNNGCEVWWDAWAAAGTLGAVVVALSLAGIESRRRKSESAGRSMWVALSLYTPLRQWAGQLSAFKRALDSDLMKALDMADGDYFGRPVLTPPSGFRSLRKEIHELGEIAGPLAQACFLISEVHGKWRWIEEGLRGDFDGDEHVRAMKLLHGNIEDADRLLRKSIGSIEERLRERKLVKVRSYVRVRFGKRTTVDAELI